MHLIKKYYAINVETMGLAANSVQCGRGPKARTHNGWVQKPALRPLVGGPGAKILKEKSVNRSNYFVCGSQCLLSYMGKWLFLRNDNFFAIVYEKWLFFRYRKRKNQEKQYRKRKNRYRKRKMAQKFIGNHIRIKALTSLFSYALAGSCRLIS